MSVYPKCRWDGALPGSLNPNDYAAMMVRMTQMPTGIISTVPLALGAAIPYKQTVDPDNKNPCNLLIYKMDDVFKTQNPALTVKEWVDNWDQYSYGNSTDNMMARFFNTPVTTPACSQMDSQAWYKNDPTLINLYQNTCLPIATSDVNGDVARMYAAKNPVAADLAMQSYCKTSNPNDPRCSCYNKWDPDGYYQMLNKSGAAFADPTCWFYPCRTPDKFYTTPGTSQCTDLPSCTVINNIIVEGGGNFDNNQINQSVSCSKTDNQPGSGNKILDFAVNNYGLIGGGIIGIGALIILYGLSSGGGSSTPKIK